ncbi:hypothetical protein [Bartonella bacilliformis]|uniref:hypothetical protein n=1 Tax=Bartonella bacilliformis TaxID=774 RepID=UPI0004A1966D|nr:hypothetical protein [Bartonella bacilliformis]KEG24925.1 hypothetical protein H708_00161 [Bartonella bacilliformis VAB9028]
MERVNVEGAVFGRFFSASSAFCALFIFFFIVLAGMLDAFFFAPLEQEVEVISRVMAEGYRECMLLLGA